MTLLRRLHSRDMVLHPRSTNTYTTSVFSSNCLAWNVWRSIESQSVLFSPGRVQAVAQRPACLVKNVSVVGTSDPERGNRFPTERPMMGQHWQSPCHDRTLSANIVISQYIRDATSGLTSGFEADTGRKTRMSGPRENCNAETNRAGPSHIEGCRSF